jgi:hypothetical protein
MCGIPGEDNGESVGCGEDKGEEDDDDDDEGEGGMERARLVMMSMSRPLGSCRTWSACVRMRCAKSFTTCASTKFLSCLAPTSLAASSTRRMLLLQMGAKQRIVLSTLHCVCVRVMMRVVPVQLLNDLLAADGL